MRLDWFVAFSSTQDIACSKWYFKALQNIGTASNVFADTVSTQRSYTYRPPDPSRFREEIEKNTATQVPRAAGEAVRTLGPVWSESTINQTFAESMLPPQWTKGKLK